MLAKGLFSHRISVKVHLYYHLTAEFDTLKMWEMFHVLTCPVCILRSSIPNSNKDRFRIYLVLFFHHRFYFTFKALLFQFQRGSSIFFISSDPEKRRKQWRCIFISFAKPISFSSSFSRLDQGLIYIPTTFSSAGGGGGIGRAGLRGCRGPKGREKNGANGNWMRTSRKQILDLRLFSFHFLNLLSWL